MGETVVDVRAFKARPIISGDSIVAGGTRFHRPGGFDDYLLIMTVSGSAWFGSPERKMQIHSGDVLLVQPNQPVDQDVFCKRGWHRMFALFEPRPHWLRWLDWPQVVPGCGMIHLGATGKGTPVRDCLERAAREFGGFNRHRTELAMNALEAALLWLDDANSKSEQARLDPRVTSAMDFISRNLSQRLSLHQISESAGLSPAQLVRLFRQQLDVSPMQFMERQRLGRAIELLQMTPQSISQIATQVGYESPFYFSTRFKRFTGQSPRTYRRNSV